MKCCAREVRRRLLIEHGYVLSMDDGDRRARAGDVLIEDGRIAAVAPTSASTDAEVVDARGTVVMPGFVDTHRHTWQTALRGDLRRLDAAATTSAGSASTISPRLHGRRTSTPATTSARSRRSTRASRRSSTSRTASTRPTHADAAMRGPARRGHPGRLRLRLLPGARRRAATSPTTPSGSPTRAASQAEHSRPATACSTMGVALTEPGLVPFDADRGRGRVGARARRARHRPHRLRLGPRRPTGDRASSHAHGLLDAEQVHVHCNACSDDELRRCSRSAGAKVSVHARRPSCRWAWATRSIGARARARHAADARLRHRLAELGRHVRPDADRPSVPARDGATTA